MTHTDTIPLCETLDDSWDDDVLDLIRTTPLVYDADGVPVGYLVEQIFGLEGAYLAARSL